MKSLSRNLQKHLLRGAGAAVSFLAFAGCYQLATQEDTTPPQVYILKWERNSNGTQGSQTTIQPGGQFTVRSDWLGPSQANIRVYGDGAHGVRKLTVSGSGSGPCSTATNEQGFRYVFDKGTASFPTHVETAPGGTTRSFMVFHLDSSVLLGQLCSKLWNQEYKLRGGYDWWTVTATAENGSGLSTTGTFRILAFCSTVDCGPGFGTTMPIRKGHARAKSIEDTAKKTAAVRKEWLDNVNTNIQKLSQ